MADSMRHCSIKTATLLCCAAASLSACAYFKVVPENAEAFEAGLYCRMARNEVESWAGSKQMGPLACTLPASRGLPHDCDTGTGRVVHRLLFDAKGELVSVQPGYVYDLTHLTYEDPVELCGSAGG